MDGRYPLHSVHAGAASQSERDKERLQQAAELIEALKDDLAEGAILIVEGRTDAEALQRLGVHGTLFCAKSSSLRPLDLAERLDTSSKIIILTDFDRAGEQLAGFLRGALERRRGRVDLTYRKRLAALMRGYVKDVRDLEEHLRNVVVQKQGSAQLPERTRSRRAKVNMTRKPL